MFPESFVEHWVRKLTKPGEYVLDPFCGRGTAPFQALLIGRPAIGNDINPVAYVVTKAKTNAPSPGPLRRRLTLLERFFDPDEWSAEAAALPDFFHVAYHPTTLQQVVYLRSRLNWRGDSDVDTMLAALTLGILHGESLKSPSYLSNQMPRTISTKPAYSIRFWRERGLIAPPRDAFDLIRRQITFRYESQPPESRAKVYNTDMRELHMFELPSDIRCVVTSPPYLDVTNFEEDQWLRLWFLGGPPRPTKGRVSRDDRYENRDAYWRLLGDMWRVLGVILDSRADVVVRLGGKGLSPEQIVEGLYGTSAYSRRQVRLH